MAPATRERNLEAILNDVLDELDLKAQRAQSEGPADKKGEYWSCQRRNPRYSFRCDCTARFFATAARDIATLPGRTRNLSRGGVGLLVKRPFAAGEVLEIELVKHATQAPTYLGGEVRFCRYAGRGYYEVGLALTAAGQAPIFSKNPLQAMKMLDWVRNARFPE
jgi:hypothetical protein